MKKEELGRVQAYLRKTLGAQNLEVRPQPRRTRFWRWRDRLFILLNNLSLDATEFFRIPPNRVVELGGQIEI